MSENTSEHRVIPTSEEIVSFECGHKGPATYIHKINGHEFKLNPTVLERRGICGQCLLEQNTSSMTQCSVCGAPIFRGQNCLNDKGNLICMSVKCSIGPIGIDPGVWDGKQWIHALQAGTMKMFSP